MLDNIDFRNQRTRFSKNSYVAKNQTKMPVGVTFWTPGYLTKQAMFKHDSRFRANKKKTLVYFYVLTFLCGTIELANLARALLLN